MFVKCELKGHLFDGALLGSTGTHNVIKKKILRKMMEELSGCYRHTWQFPGVTLIALITLITLITLDISGSSQG